MSSVVQFSSWMVLSVSLISFDIASTFFLSSLTSTVLIILMSEDSLRSVLLLAALSSDWRISHFLVRTSLFARSPVREVPSCSCLDHSTVTDFARFFGLSMSQPFSFATK